MARVPRYGIPFLALALATAGCAAGTESADEPAPAPSPSPSPTEEPVDEWELCREDEAQLEALLDDWIDPWQRAYDVNEGKKPTADKVRIMRAMARRFERLLQRLRGLTTHPVLAPIRRDMRRSFAASVAGWRENADAWAAPSDNTHALDVLDTAADRWEDARDALRSGPCNELD